MILGYQIVCLAVTLYVLQKYATMGTYSHTHRLLPLVLGLIGVYNFYEIVLCITHATKVFSLLEDLLLLQVLYLLVFYIQDLMHAKLHGILTNGLFISMIVMNIVVLAQYGQPELYSRSLLLIVLWYMILIIASGTYAYIKSRTTKRTHHVANLIYLAFLLPAISIFVEKLGLIVGNILVPFSLVCTCGIIYYLIVTEQLINPLYILQEHQYDTSDIPLIFFDSDYYYLGSNQAARYLFPKELNVITKKTRPELYLADIREMAKQIDKSKQIELNGRHYKCQLNAVYFHGKLRGYSLSIIDITAQKNETKLMASLKDAAETQTAQKSRFLATMSHDLRSPLHAVIGICDILGAKSEISGQNRSLIYHIRSAGNTLLAQVDAILEYSKLEAGKMELASNYYNIDGIIEELAHDCVINLQSRPVNFSFDVLDDYPRQLMGDEIRVREIILNLLSNAVKFTREGEIRCELTCNRVEGRHRVCFCCSVTDTGPGMSKEQIDQIFEEFITFSPEQKQEGAGLGLCIVRQLTELMGGTVTASSDGVSGSTITATFYQDYVGEEVCPAFSLTGESLLWQTAVLQHSVIPNYVYPEAKVLLADDMRINQEIFRELTTPWKFEVDFVENGKEAVKAVQKQKYQLIFLDQMMPELTGDEAAELIRKCCDTSLILMTANFMDDMRGRYVRHGFSACLPKPVEIGKLQKILEDYMPIEYRCTPAPTEMDPAFLSVDGSVGGYIRTLEAFVQEMKPLIKELSVYAKDDLELFRIKVHGIKGVSRQIGRAELSESAEILEMAAKTQNKRFIQAHMEAFRQELSDNVLEVEEELSHIPVQEDLKMGEGQNVNDLFERLKEGFDSYQINKIEKSIYALEHAELTEEETKLLDRAKEAYDELDYERGSRLFL